MAETRLVVSIASPLVAQRSFQTNELIYELEQQPSQFFYRPVQRVQVNVLGMGVPHIVVADERDVIRYLRTIDDLHERPRFYNTITTNCISNVWLHAHVNPERTVLAEDC